MNYLIDNPEKLKCKINGGIPEELDGRHTRTFSCECTSDDHKHAPDML